MTAVRRTPVMELIWKVHKVYYRWSGGRIGGRVGPMSVLMITIRGRRSGRPRSVALNYLEDAGRYIVFTTHAGEDREPAWWLNLRDAGVADAQIGSRHLRVRAHAAQGAERERLWSRSKDIDSAHAVYEARTKRRIKVVVLEPI